MFALSNKDLQARYEAMSLNININVEPKGYLSYRDSKPLFGIRLDIPSEGLRSLCSRTALWRSREMTFVARSYGSRLGTSARRK